MMISQSYVASACQKIHSDHSPDAELHSDHRQTELHSEMNSTCSHFSQNANNTQQLQLNATPQHIIMTEEWICLPACTHTHTHPLLHQAQTCISSMQWYYNNGSTPLPTLPDGCIVRLLGLYSVGQPSSLGLGQWGCLHIIGARIKRCSGGKQQRHPSSLLLLVLVIRVHLSLPSGLLFSHYASANNTHASIHHITTMALIRRILTTCGHRSYSF